MLLSEHEARQVLQAYQSRVHAAVPRPRGLELWDEYYLNRVPQEEIERILRMPGSDLTWYELLIVSSAAFDETLTTCLSSSPIWLTDETAIVSVP